MRCNYREKKTANSPSIHPFKGFFDSHVSCKAKHYLQKIRYQTLGTAIWITLLQSFTQVVSGRSQYSHKNMNSNCKTVSLISGHKMIVLKSQNVSFLTHFSSFGFLSWHKLLLWILKYVTECQGQLPVGFSQSCQAKQDCTFRFLLPFVGDYSLSHSYLLHSCHMTCSVLGSKNMMIIRTDYSWGSSDLLGLYCEELQTSPVLDNTIEH